MCKRTEQFSIDRPEDDFLKPGDGITGGHWIGTVRLQQEAWPLPPFQAATKLLGDGQDELNPTEIQQTAGLFTGFNKVDQVIKGTKV